MEDRFNLTRFIEAQRYSYDNPTKDEACESDKVWKSLSGLEKSSWIVTVALVVGMAVLSGCSGATREKTDSAWVKEVGSVSAGSRSGFGIDVSHHNGEIDWPTVAKTPLEFVYVKATEGATHVDKRYRENVEGARKAGFKVGSYHFFRMTSSAHDQFANFKRNVEPEKQDLIPMVDVETADSRSSKELRDSLNVFIGLVKEHFGVRPMIYATNRSYNELCEGMYPSYPLYIGRYGDKAPQIKRKGHYTIWQYTETAHIDGIPKPVDQARFHPDASLQDILYAPSH